MWDFIISSLLNLLVHTRDLCVYNSGKSHSLNTIWSSDYDRCTWKMRHQWMNLDMERHNKPGSIVWSQMPSKAPCSAPGDNRHFSKDNTRLFQQETQTPNGIQKMSVSLPSLEEPKGSKGLVQKKGTGDYGLLSPCAGHSACIISLHPNSITSILQIRKMRLAHGQKALSNGTMIWTHISHLPKPKLFQRRHAVSHRDRRHVPKRKARVLRMNRKG